MKPSTSETVLQQINTNQGYYLSPKTHEKHQLFFDYMEQ